MKSINAVVVAIVSSLLLLEPSVGQGIEDTDDYSYDGFLEASHDVMVSAVEIGRLDSLLVKVGDRVIAGQEIATLENATQLIAVEIAKQRSETRGDLDAAIAERSLHVSRTEQLRVLASMGTARPDELSRAETDLLVSDARVRIAMEEQQSRKLELRQQEIQLERRRILSPIQGVVARVIRQPGEYISPGDSAIARIISRDSMVAVFNLPTTEAIQLRIDQRVPVRPRSVPRIVEGRVESLSPAIDGESGTIAVRITIDNRDESLLPGDRCLLANVRQLNDANQAGKQQLMLRQFSR